MKGALPSTPGRFNFAGTLGLDAANAMCDMKFAGTHACSLDELKTSTTYGDLVNLKDIANMQVTSFWAIDSAAPPLQQCNDDAVGGSGINWEYATAHTSSRGEKVDLNNSAGTLAGLNPVTGRPDAAHMGLQCNFSGNAWVACCL